jgi:Zn-dependent peptidase ImmA (M78 family)
MIEKIKVGGLTYSVELVEWETDINGDMQFGLIHKDTTRIELNTLPSEQIQSQTLIHEVMHAVFMEAGLDIVNEEDIVNRVSLILYQVLQDNDLSFIYKK